MKKGIQTFKVLEPSEKLPLLIQLIESKIVDFTSSHTFKKIMVKKKGETQHTTAFSLFMGKKQTIFTFQNEVAQKGNHKVDVGVYDQDTDELIFTIEAKVLPTPNGTKEIPRDKHEYVYRKNGTGAGIERFKKCVHGLDTNEDLLPENGVIAYIKKETFDYWFEKANQWITDAGWEESEKLNKVYFETVAKLYSQHIRTDNAKTNLTLHHFWVYVTSQ
jgi:hypothetical protein